MSADSVGADDAVGPEVGLREAGLKVSDGTVFHPRVEVSTGYQTNVFFQDGSDPSGLVSAPLVRIGVGAAFASAPVRRLQALAPGAAAPTRKVAYNVDLALTWHQYVSGDRAVQKQSDLGVGALLDLKLFPNGALTFELRDGFTRAVAPPQARTGDNVDRDRNEAMAGFVFKPGGGALRAHLNYRFTVDLFERSNLSFANRLSHTFNLGAKYQWLPKTQFSFEAQYGFITPADTVFKSGASPLRLWLGASSLITPRLGMVLRGGYVNGFYNAGPSYSSYLATVEGRLAIGPTVRTALGYTHDFADSVIANFYEDHKFYVRARAQFGGRFELKLSASFSLRSYDYPGMAPFVFNGATLCGDTGCTTSNRFDAVLHANAFLGYQINKWFNVSVAYSLVSDTTEAFVRANGVDDSAGYVWQELVATAEARF